MMRPALIHNTIIFNRFIIVLYADRGLVKNGEINNLFDILYTVLVSVMTIWTLALMVIHFGKDLTHTRLTSICLNKASPMEISNRNSILVAVICTLVFIIVFLIVVKVAKYVKNRMKNGQVPVIFGRYQRNALTLTQLLVLVVMISLFAIKNLIVLVMVPMNLELDFARPYLFVSNLVVLNFLIDFLLPTIALWILYKNVPKFFQENTIEEVQRTTPFYVISPTIVPRVDFEVTQPSTGRITNTTTTNEVNQPPEGNTTNTTTTNEVNQPSEGKNTIPVPTIVVSKPTVNGPTNPITAVVVTQPSESQNTIPSPTIELTKHQADRRSQVTKASTKHQVTIHAENEGCKNLRQKAGDILEMKSRKMIQGMTPVE